MLGFVCYVGHKMGTVKAGWDIQTQVREEVTFTAGRIQVPLRNQGINQGWTIPDFTCIFSSEYRHQWP